MHHPYPLDLPLSHPAAEAAHREWLRHWESDTDAPEMRRHDNQKQAARARLRLRQIHHH